MEPRYFILKKLSAKILKVLKFALVRPVPKSVFLPTQEKYFREFLLNSDSMTIPLPPAKAVNVKQACENLLCQTTPTIMEVAQVRELIVSSFGELHYRQEEQSKILALQTSKGDYDAPMSLTNEAKLDLHWRADNVILSFKPIMKTTPDITLTTDAPKTGWGAVCEGRRSGGL